MPIQLNNQPKLDPKEILAQELEALAAKVRSGEIMPERYSNGWEPKFHSIHGDTAFRSVKFELEYTDYGDRNND